MSKNIDQLPVAAALTGAETLPINQTGVTKHSTISAIIAFMGSVFDAFGTSAASIATHLAAFPHGDITHTNRTALNAVSGINTGDQDLSGYATTPAMTAAINTVASATAPAGPAARMIWYNTVDGGIYQRNSGNTGWILKGYLDRPYEGVSALLIAIGGQWRYPYSLLLLPPGGVQIASGSTSAPSGKWIQIFDYNENNASGGLTSLTFNDLSGVIGGFYPNHIAGITILSLPALTTIGSVFNPNNMAVLNTLSLPALTVVGSSFLPSNMPDIITLDLPALTTVGSSFSPSAMPGVTTLNLPALTTVGAYIMPTAMPGLTTLSFPVIISIGSGINLYSDTDALTSFTLGTTLKSVGGDVALTACALTQASVDGILARLAALNGANGTTAFSSKSVTITGTSATPSAAGLASKATLVARGCTVTHN